MAAKPPQVGQRYRHVGTVFRNAVWVLSDIFTGRDGIEHARLTSAYDSSQSKTVALSVIADTRRFTLVENSEKSVL
jgi:hypothetical protein